MFFQGVALSANQMEIIVIVHEYVTKFMVVRKLQAKKRKEQDGILEK